MTVDQSLLFLWSRRHSPEASEIGLYMSMVSWIGTGKSTGNLANPWEQSNILIRAEAAVTDMSKELKSDRMLYPCNTQIQLPDNTLMMQRWTVDHWLLICCAAGLANAKRSPLVQKCWLACQKQCIPAMQGIDHAPAGATRADDPLL